MDMHEKVEELRRKEREIEAGGGIKRIERQHKEGKYFARERLDMLFDSGTFVELDKFVQHRATFFEMATVVAPDEGVITGYGKIDGRIVYAYADDFTVLGGSLGEMHSKKMCKVMDMALANGAPIVGLNDSGGARIQEVVDAMSGYGQIFFRNARMSGSVPQISAIVGPCAGGAVYSPALTDFILMVDKTSHMFITGPNVIRAAVNEEVTEEQIGGAYTHNAVSGVAHFFVNNEQDCYQYIRKLISFLPSNCMENPPVLQTGDDPGRIVDELVDIVPVNPTKAYDMKQVLSRIFDNGDFLEVQPLFATNIIVGFARLNGQTVGVVASQPNMQAGCIDINAADKGARFIRFCDCYNIPLTTIVDVPGFLPGTNQEFGGIIRHGAKMLYAYSEATVPKISLIIRKSYGGAYQAMCGKDLGTDMVLAWPTGEIAVMGPEGAANVVFRKEIEAAADPVATRANKIEEYRRDFLNPYVAASRGFVDRVIEPQNSRKELIQALELFHNKQDRLPFKKHSNIPL
ncbi:MAG: acyl-CoA carboxylase subunit beta [Negativicutes bacterium]